MNIILFCLFCLCNFCFNHGSRIISINSNAKQTVFNSIKTFGYIASAVTYKQLPALSEEFGVNKKGLFEPCPTDFLSSCVSSQDDRPNVFLPPWCYDGSFENAKRKLLAKIINIQGAIIKSDQDISNSNRYIRVSFENNDETKDEAEFYFTPNDSTIQFRSLRADNKIDFGKNRNRLEFIRQGLKFDEVPVLRNRKRVLFFIESPLDSFGPSTSEFDSLVDRVSEDMNYLENKGNGVLAQLDPTYPVWTYPYFLTCINS